MQNNELISIALYGQVCEDNTKWIEWYEYVKNFIHLLGYEPNYVSVESITFKSGKVQNLKRMEKKMIQALNNNDVVKWLSIYALPNDFEIAAFDYNVLAVRNKGLVCVIMDKEKYNNLDAEKLVRELGEYVIITDGEIFEMNRDESPLLYASKVNSPEKFKTLKIIKKF